MTDSVMMLVPVFGLIVTGAVLHRLHLINETQWSGFERVTYLVLFPAVIIDTLARADLSSVPFARMATALVGAILLMTALLLAMRPLLQRYLKINGPAFTSVFQGATRWNTFVALALGGSLYGKEGTTLSAVAIAAMIPLLNVLAIGVLSRYASAKRLTALGFIKTLVTNPFIWSCAIGIAINVGGVALPKPVLIYTDMLGKASLACGLLVVGAGLDLSRLKRPHPAMVLSLVLRLFLMPFMAAMIAKTLGLGGVTLAIVVISAAVPTASGGYILARQMGGDAPLMAEILSFQTVTAMLTIPMVLAWLL
jgi:malonate transporter